MIIILFIRWKNFTIVILINRCFSLSSIVDRCILINIIYNWCTHHTRKVLFLYFMALLIYTFKPFYLFFISRKRWTAIFGWNFSIFYNSRRKSAFRKLLGYFFILSFLLNFPFLFIKYLSVLYQIYIFLFTMKVMLKKFIICKILRFVVVNLWFKCTFFYFL